MRDTAMYAIREKVGNKLLNISSGGSLSFKAVFGSLDEAEVVLSILVEDNPHIRDEFEVVEAQVWASKDIDSLLKDYNKVLSYYEDLAMKHNDE